MNYDEARHEVEQGVISGKYTRIQGRRLRAAIRVFERYDRAVPIWSYFEDLAFGPDWAERIVEASHLTEARPFLRSTDSSDSGEDCPLAVTDPLQFEELQGSVLAAYTLHAAGDGPPAWALMGVVLGFLLTTAAVSAWSSHGWGGPDDSGGFGGGSGPPPGSPPDEPAWWPEFERGFRAYVEGGSAVRRSRERPPS
jgi:hypothetical protein